MLIECKRQRLYRPVHTVPSYSSAVDLSARASYIQHLSLLLQTHISRSLQSTILNHRQLDVLAQPPNPLSVPLPHNHAAHEDLNRADALERHLTLARCLVQAQHAAQLVLGDGIWVIDLVAEDDERRALELLHGEQGVELGLGLLEALVVLCVDEEDDAGYLWDCL